MGYYRSGIELPPIIHLLPLWLLGRFGLSHPARRRTFQIHNLRAGYIKTARRGPGHRVGADYLSLADPHPFHVASV